MLHARGSSHKSASSQQGFDDEDAEGDGDSEDADGDDESDSDRATPGCLTLLSNLKSGDGARSSQDGSSKMHRLSRKAGSKPAACASVKVGCCVRGQGFRLGSRVEDVKV